ncbi:diguanylate cyclase or its enzymatically inactive variants [Pseudomonas syringae pv. actinidiae]|uniref:Diguanylate cyclase or its enzymatically inactive variants n=1 Tax=Pseudomonas syringae pv. actinidiae TaxID=103796 RepID=A0AAN4TML1_PSESF|nr:diguanylate cyclase or its enzymatically inactive variants [Pseudomonas syringae pv. actinidiae]
MGVFARKRESVGFCSFHRLDSFFVGDRFVGHASFLQNSIYNLLFKHNRTYLVHLLLVLVVPGNNLFRFLIGGRHFLDHFTNTSIVRLQVELLDDLGNDQTQLDATLGLLFKQLCRQLVWLDVAAKLLNSLYAQTVDFVFQQRFRHFDRVGGQQTVHDLILDLGLDRLTQLALHVLANFGAEAFDTGFLDAELLEELFVQLRQLWLGNGIDGDGELGSLAGQVEVLIVLWEGHVQNALFTGLGANQTVFKARDHAAGTQHQLGTGGRTASEYFAVDLAHEIDVQLVFVLGGTVGHFEANVLLAQHFQHIVQIAVSDVGGQTLYSDGVETGNGEFREYFESSDVFQIFAFFERFWLYSRSARRVQLLLNHSFVKGSLNQIAQCFLARAVLVTLTNHAHWHLARAEARDLGFTCSLLQTLVDFSLDAFGRHANGHAALKSGSIFNRNLHGYSSLHRR